MHVIEEDIDEDIGDFLWGSEGIRVTAVSAMSGSTAGTGIFTALLDGVFQLEGC